MNSFLLTAPHGWAITFLASFLLWFMYLGLLLLWLVNGRVKKEVAIHAFLASVLTWILVEMLKSFIPSVRPFQISGYSPLTLTIPNDNSFPSSHAAVAFALAVSIWLHNKRLGLLFIVGAIGVSLGRILANVHFLFDILFGGWLGAVIAYGTSKIHFFQKTQSKA